jgi:hypothetical protein
LYKQQKNEVAKALRTRVVGGCMVHSLPKQRPLVQFSDDCKEYRFRAERDKCACYGGERGQTEWRGT